MAKSLQNRGKVQKPLKKNVKNASARRRATLEQLAWKPVELPENLEDAEGFYELEEIDNVEVIRDEKGQVEYRALPADVDDEVVASGSSEIGRDDMNGVSYDDWEGFSDSADGPTENKEEEPLESQNDFEVLMDDEAVEVDVSAWAGLELASDIMAAISRLGHERPTPIQQRAIREVLNGRDVIGKAPTGSGKTLAYGIPIVEHFLSKAQTDTSEEPTIDQFSPIALIISPTRELARQIERHLTELCSSLSSAPRMAMLTGGLSVYKQQRLFTSADIVIGTPGRLWDIMSSAPGAITGLKRLKFLVVDEADRLLSQGHFKEVEQIIDSLERKEVSTEGQPDKAVSLTYQTLVFSATFSPNLHQSLAGKASSTKSDSLSYLLQRLPFHDPEGKPKYIDINPASTSQLAPLLRTRVLHCDTKEKDLHLYALLLLQPAGTKVLVFVNNIHAVRRLAPVLQYLNIDAHGLHGEMQQKSRLKTLERFAAASSDSPSSSTQPASSAFSTIKRTILVTTDVASRGLDIPQVQLVVHYHVPREADTYIHRSGRTARAENSGLSVLFCAPDETTSVKRLIAKVHARDVKAAQGAKDESGKTVLKQIYLDVMMISRLKNRVSAAQRIVDAESAREKASHENNWLQKYADELGRDLEEEGLGQFKDRGGKGKGGKRTAKFVDPGEIREWKAELKQELGRRVNLGVSEKFLTSGGVDVNALLKGELGEFLGPVKTVGLELD